MDAIINVFLTDNRICPYNRGLLSIGNQVDTFKYMLASMKPIEYLFDNIHIFCELDGPYKHRQLELDTYISELIDNRKLVYNTTRNFYQHQWREALHNIFNKADTEHYFMSCNHDHIFVDSSLDVINGVIEEWKNDDNHFKCIYPTHFPETICVTALYNKDNPPQGYYTSHFFKDMGDGTLFLNKKMLEYLFLRKDYGMRPMPRPDNSAFAQLIEPCPNTKCFAPLKELFRHFDGYGHTGAHGQAGISIGVVPPLDVPDGFFDAKKIEIVLYSDNNKVGDISINPKLNYKTIDNNGVDLRCLEQDIPLFWKQKDIVLTKENFDISFVEARNNHYAEQMNTHAHQHGCHLHNDYYRHVII